DRFGEVGDAARGELGQETEDLEDPRAAAGRRHLRDELVADAVGGDAVEVREADVRERGGEAARLIELLAGAEAHGRGAVDDEGDLEIFLFLVEADEEV